MTSWRGKLPHILPDIVRRWSCHRHQSWNIANLERRYGQQLFSCGMNAHNAQEPVLIKLQEYIKKYIHNVTSVKTSDLFALSYIFDPVFDVDCPTLLEDYELPVEFSALDCLQPLDEEFKPDYRWFLLGGLGSGSPLHVDPCYTSAWNAVVVGQKLWVLLPPHISSVTSSTFSTAHTQSLIHHSIEQTFSSNGILQIIPQVERHHLAHIQHQLAQALHCRDPPSVVVLLQRAGEILYVPSGWYHAALNITPSVAITHNFVEPAHVESFLQSYHNEAHDKFTEQQWEHIRRTVRPPER